MPRNAFECRDSCKRPALLIEALRFSFRDRAVTICDLVLARVSNSTAILSPSLLRCRRDSNRIFLLVLAHCTTDFCIQPHAASLSDGDRRFVCPAAAGSKVLSPFSLVAGCHGCFYHRRRLRKSPPMVPTSSGADRRCVCRRHLCLCCLENFFASRRGDIVGSAREFVHNPRVLVHSTVLPIICATLRCRSGIEKSDTARRIDRGRGHGRSDHLLLCRAQGLAFSRDRTRFTTATRTTANRQSRTLSGCSRRGATHFVFTRNTFWWSQSYPEFVGYLSKHATLIEATPEFRIYKLTVR